MTLTVEGAGTTDVGRTVDVAIHGDTAYVRDLKVPVGLIIVGVGFGALGLVTFGKGRRRLQR